MKKNDEKTQILQAILDRVTQYQEGQLSVTSVQPILQGLFEQLRLCDQADFDAAIEASQPLMFKSIQIFDSGKISPTDLKGMTFATMQTLERLAGVFEGCHAMIFVKPVVAAFILKLLNFIISLAAALVRDKSAETAQLMLAITCEIHIPFYQSSLFTVMPLKEGKSSFDLRPSLLDVRDIGELAMQQHAILQCEHHQYDKARATLIFLDAWYSGDHELSEFKQEQMEALYRTQAPALKKLYKADRELWKRAFGMINNITVTLKPQIFKSMRYFLWGKLALEEVVPNLSLASCYLDLSVTHYLAIKSNIPPGKLINELKSLAARFVEVENFASAMRCYRTTQKIYSKYSLAIVDYQQQTHQLEQNVCKLKKVAFLQLKKKWEELAIGSLQDVQSIDFDEAKCWCQITYSDRAFMLCHARYLNELEVEKNVQRDTCVITLNSPYELSARALRRSFLQAQQRFQHRRHESQQAAELLQKRFVEVVASEDSHDESPLPLKGSSLYDMASHVVRKIPRPAPSKSTGPPKTPPAKILPTISWGDEYPTYHPSKGIVYPIPNPLVINSAMPKGIFYAYLDPLQLIELSKEMLDQFELQLARGKIVGKGDAHGIRSVIGELNDDSPYMFKINIHGEDIRLYGRKVATAITPEGKATVLIAFDQAIRHDEQLLLHPEERKPGPSDY
jgi:hypothetical protein